jgi:hypothetical protein
MRAVIAENLLLKQQLIVLRRARQRAPNLSVGDFGLSVAATAMLSIGRGRSHLALPPICPPQSPPVVAPAQRPRPSPSVSLSTGQRMPAKGADEV